VAAIWSTDPTGGWKLLPTAGFPDEDTLHTLVEQGPQLLPLAGSPRLAIVGREVRLGSGSADLIAVEPSGRVVVIEVKLAANAEARRAVVAQVLAYAAHLHGLTPAQLEAEVLGQHLRSREYESLFAAVTDASQDQSTDEAHRRLMRD
jgi:RecB family exonuclease